MNEQVNLHEPCFPTRQEALLLPEEEAVVQEKLWPLLVKQVCLQTQGDHSSLREEQAAELLESLLFSLQYHLRKNGLPMHRLLTADLSAMLEQGQAELQIEVHTASTMYAMATKRVETFGSIALRDTLLQIGCFFKYYDAILHAQDIPASIDYPLCQSVPETLRGVLYIKEYLERLLIENKLVTCFPKDNVEMLLRRASPDFRGLLQNLYEPVAANAIGCAMLGKKKKQLLITVSEAETIYTCMTALSFQAASERLKQAAGVVCEQTGMTDKRSNEYLRRTAVDLYPRLVISGQSAAGVFAAM